MEARERRRLRNKAIKTEKNIGEVAKFLKELEEFCADFDSEMDFLANRASFE